MPRSRICQFHCQCQIRSNDPRRTFLGSRSIADSALRNRRGCRRTPPPGRVAESQIFAKNHVAFVKIFKAAGSGGDIPAASEPQVKGRFPKSGMIPARAGSFAGAQALLSIWLAGAKTGSSGTKTSVKSVSSPGHLAPAHRPFPDSKLQWIWADRMGTPECSGCRSMPKATSGHDYQPSSCWSAFCRAAVGASIPP